MKSSINLKFLYTWLGLIIGIVVSCLLAAAFKENPLHVFKVLTTSFLATRFDLGLTLFYTTCFIFSGLAFSIPLKAGIFNIAAEGQIIFSAFVAAILGSSIKTNSIFLDCLFIFFLTFITSMLLSGLIALFKIYRNAHEVVVAIMFNFILTALTTWLTVSYFQNSESQNPETALISSPLRFLQQDPIKIYLEQSPVSLFFVFSIICCFVLGFLEKHTIYGYQFSALGSNSLATERLGYSKKKLLLISMALAGFFSACVGLTEVFGNSLQFKIGFSPQYGFLGIAVALLARQNFIAMIFSAFLMACLHKGSSDLDLETQYLTRDFSKVLQALIIFSVAGSYLLAEKWPILKKYFKRGFNDSNV